jgi:VPDSG-CTERM motif
MIRSLTIWATAIAVTLLTAPAYALSIDDDGVVGIIEPLPGNGSSAEDETDWANYLLSLGANDSDTADADDDGNGELYETGDNDYNDVLDTGVQGGSLGNDDPIPNVAGAEYVLAKYDGPNAGYVLYYIPDFDGGSGNLPEFAFPIWGNEGQYRVSHITTFGSTSVPDGGATLILLGMALSGLGMARRFISI